MSAEQEALDFAVARSRMVLEALAQVASLGTYSIYQEGHCIFCDQEEPKHLDHCAIKLVEWMLKKKMITLP